MIKICEKTYEVDGIEKSVYVRGPKRGNEYV